ncbi:MAG: hypothetical protein ACE5D3_06915 [Candidatus Binatia bacterium]
MMVSIVGDHYQVDKYAVDTGVVTLIGNLPATNPTLTNMPEDFVQVGLSLFLVGTFMPPIRVFGPTSVEFVQFWDALPGTWSFDGVNTVTSDSPGTYFTDQLLSIGDTVAVGSSGGVSATVATVGVPDTDTFTVGAGFGGPFVGRRLFTPGVAAPTLSGPGSCSSVDFHQGRLVLAGFDATPTRVVLSEANDPFVTGFSESFAGGAVDVEVTARTDTPFRWILSKGNRLFFGGEHQMISTAPGLEITGLAGGFRVEVHDTVGFSTAKPVADDARVVAVSEDSSDLHSVSFDELTQSLVGQPLSALNHALSNGILEIVLKPPTADDPVKRVFGRRASDIVVWSQPVGNAQGAWSRITLPADAGLVRLLRLDSRIFLVIQTTETSQMGISELTFGGTSKLDFSRVRTSGTPTTSWTGADSTLRLQKGFAIVDGIPDGYVDVDAAGAFTTSRAGTQAVIGLSATARMRLLEPQIEDEKGSSAFRKRKRVRAMVKVRDTAQVTFNEQPLFSNVLPAPGQDLPVRSDAVEVGGLGWSRSIEDEIQSVGAYDVTVEGVSREVVI